MTIELSWGSAAAACAVAGMIGKVVHGLMSSALETRDSKIKDQAVALEGQHIAHSAEMSGLRATQKVLFDKYDGLNKELQGYKLHVAETYVAREALKEQLLPINKSLDNIQRELREERRS